MRRKSGTFLGFTGIRLVSFVISAASFLILVMIAMMIWSVFAPKPTADAAATSFFEDLKIKINLLEREETGDSFISSGSLEKDIWIRSLHSSQARDCSGGSGKSCICICKGESCSNIIKCEKFSIELKPPIKLRDKQNVILRLKKNQGAIDVECLNRDNTWDTDHSNCRSSYVEVHSRSSARDTCFDITSSTGQLCRNF